VRALLASATDVLAGTDDGVYKSSGGGAWQPLGQGSGPGKLNGSVQSLMSLPGNVLLAGVASGGVWKSSDGGASWTPPAANSGMPSAETPYGFAAQPPGAPQYILVAAGSGVYRSTDSGSTWQLTSDGIPASASPIQPWVDTSQPNIWYVSTGSNGIYRSINGGLTWAPINDGLGAVRARGFQIFTAAQGAHLYAATEEGLWHALQGHGVAPPPVEWDPVTQEGLHEVSPPASNVIMWALTAPVIPGGGAFGLIAGTQSNGGYFLAFEAPDSPCPSPNTTNVTAQCPRISDLTPVDGQTLSLLPPTAGTWTGTAFIEFEYQWQRCTTASADSCADIEGAEETSYVVPKDTTFRYRVEVTATNPAPTFGTVVRTSRITGATAANPANFPGNTQVSNPSITVTPSEHQTAPVVGDSMFAANGSLAAADPTYGWFNPQATSVSFQWLRCDEPTTNCEEIPGATSRTYALTTADGTRNIQVRVTGTNASGSRQIQSFYQYDVTSAPAQIADPIPNPNGGPPFSQAPRLSGKAQVAQTLAGTVGGWKDPTTEFSRRWMRCDAQGGSCTFIQKVASTDPETGPTYLIRADDVGYTIRMIVTADVNGDISDDGIDNHLPNDVEVATPPSAVVTKKPSNPVLDVIAPVLSEFKLTNAKFAVADGPTAVLAKKKKPKRGTKFKFTLSEAAAAVIAIDKLTTGRKVGKECKKKTRQNRDNKKCTRAVRKGTLTRGNLAAGENSVKFTGRIGKKKLARGRYRATIIAADAAGNASAPKRANFKIVRG